MKKSNGKNRIYADYASTTPMLPEVMKVMMPFFSEEFANPSSLYREGIQTKSAIKDARKKIAACIGCKPEEIVFTGSGTEADNLALFGVTRYFLRNPKILKGKKPHIITSVIEHPAILETARELQKEGVEVSFVSVNEKGIVSVDEIKKLLKKETVLVSIMHVNNEIGTIQPISKIGRMISDFRITRKKNFPYFHTDASQSPNYLPVNVAGMLVDLLTLDASKIYGPKGIGALCIRQHVTLLPLIYGGGQEKGKRSGTENTAAIIGFAKAVEIAQNEKEKESLRVRKIRDHFITEIRRNFSGAVLNGHEELRIPNNANFCFSGLDSEFAVIKMDNLGIACSGASACRNIGDETYSYVIESFSQECKKSSLRFTFGRRSTMSDVEVIISALKKVLKK